MIRSIPELIGVLPELVGVYQSRLEVYQNLLECTYKFGQNTFSIDCVITDLFVYANRWSSFLLQIFIK